jgi:hypothetical protein
VAEVLGLQTAHDAMGLPEFPRITVIAAVTVVPAILGPSFASIHGEAHLAIAIAPHPAAYCAIPAVSPLQRLRKSDILTSLRKGGLRG